MLKLVESVSRPISPSGSVALSDHEQIVESYFRSYRVRNYSPRTTVKERRFLEGWFMEHGLGKTLFTWEAMEPVVGRKRVVDYVNALIDTGIRSDTVRSYLGILRRYFSYVLEYPFVRINPVRRIQDLYGAIEQPVTEFDMPRHVYDGERLGVPLDPGRLYDFYDTIRNRYLRGLGWKSVHARNYTLTVLAGETGLRADELLHLEIGDLFFESKRIQTRYAKGTHGSGKRSRLTLFPPLARDTVRHYLKEHRPKFCCSDRSNFMFLSPSGNPLLYSTIHKGLRDMVEIASRAGFPVQPHMSWHWFRRIFATRFIEKFPDKLSVLIKLLGHVSPNTVHCYIRHSEAWADKQIQKVLEGEHLWQSHGD